MPPAATPTPHPNADTDTDPGDRCAHDRRRIDVDRPQLHPEHERGSSGEYYGGSACGTFLSVGGALFGPQSIPAGSALSRSTSPVAWTPISQLTSGSGTDADPNTTVTTVAAGSTGIQLVQTDRWVAGGATVSTHMVVTNTTAGATWTEGVYGDVWAALSAQGDLNDSAVTSGDYDNGEAVAWNGTALANGSAAFDAETTFAGPM